MRVLADLSDVSIHEKRLQTISLKEYFLRDSSWFRAAKRLKISPFMALYVTFVFWIFRTLHMVIMSHTPWFLMY